MNRLTRTIVLSLLAVACVLPLGSCKTMYYNTMEAFGKHKRDILLTRVTDARDEQEAAKQQFKNALDQFTTLAETPGSELQDVYERLNGELEASRAKAARVRDRVDSVERVSADLFREWEGELDQYNSAELRSRSEQTLRATERQYGQLIAAMRRPLPRMDAAVESFEDHVLSLKHMRNAQVVAFLQGTVDSVEFDTARLVEEMEAAISEADAFISSMGAEAGI